MTALVLCGDCNGYGRALGRKCVPCKATGRVFPSAARDALVFDVLGPDLGGNAAVTALKLLDANRPALFEWLLEAEIVRPTEWGRNPINRDPTLGPRDNGYRPDGFEIVPADRIDERGHRLFAVVTQ